MKGNVLLAPLLFACLALSSASQPHVRRYQVVRPQRRHLRRTRDLRANEIYPDMIQYDLTIDGRNHSIHLEKNHNLIGKNYTETFYSEDGERLTTSPDQEHCYYHGHIHGTDDSSVSVQICSGISGFIKTSNQLYFIEPLGQTDEDNHAVYRKEQLDVSGNTACALKTSPAQNPIQDRDPQPAAHFVSSTQKTQPVSDIQKFVELVVVVDNTEYQKYKKETRQRVLQAVNHIDNVYRRINIRIMLVGLEIWSDKDLIDVDVKAEPTLENFMVWRRADLLQRVKHDNAQFVTGRKFDEDTVGMANKFAMCTPNSGGVNQDHHENPIGLASTIAHEMGHNFGLSHDAAQCMCGSDYNCVMTTKIKGDMFPEFFSSCSLKQLDEFVRRARPNCLQPPTPTRTLASASRCGNGMLDPGEKCDCGTVEECNNRCCDPSTCLLAEGAQCATGSCCESCQFKVSGGVCREAADDCDLPEYCTGDSSYCPEDAFRMNGEPCSKGFCHNGQCPTLDHHCWRLFGEGARVAHDVCFQANKRGEDGGNCGRDKSGFIRCSAENLKCGSIFCFGGNESITGKLAELTMYGIVKCKLAVEDDKSRNLDMVPDGASCGPNKVCLNHRCVDVSAYGKGDECAEKCNNKGVCNHKNLCHCDPGWAPPFCDQQFAELSRRHTAMLSGVCASVFTLLIVVLVIVGLVWRRRSNTNKLGRQRKIPSAPRTLDTKFQGCRPEISQPTLVASTATGAQSRLVVVESPSRAAASAPAAAATAAAAQPPNQPSSGDEQIKPPLKTLPPVCKTQEFGAKPSPPVKPRPPLPPPPAACLKPRSTPPTPPVKPRLPT